MIEEANLVYIVILNWNGWQDTIECIESLLKLNYPNYRIVVCDNYSQDNSIGEIQEWSVSKQIDVEYIEYDPNLKSGFPEKVNVKTSSNRGITLIQTGENRGFAGGNNIGIRYSLFDDSCQYVWILNNDTVVESGSLSALVERSQADSRIGICGSKLLYYDEPLKVQAWGGAKYNKWIGAVSTLGFCESSDKKVDTQEIEKLMDYVVGASMLVSRSFLTEIGLMNEEYFLYAEEIDWIARSKHRYQLGYADRSIVYHKEGKSIGTNTKERFVSYIGDYYIKRSALIYTKKYAKLSLPSIYLAMIVAILNRFKRFQFDRALMIFILLFNHNYLPVQVQKVK
jgi:GT2 family glycosyltransferase